MIGQIQSSESLMPVPSAVPGLARTQAACDRFANLHHPDPAAEAVFNAVIRAAEQPVWVL